MEVGALCSELRDTTMLSFNANQLYTVDDFGDTQVTHRTQKAVPKMESCMERIQKVLERVIRDVVGHCNFKARVTRVERACDPCRKGL